MTARAPSLVLALVLALGAGACGGSSGPAKAPKLPPANPQAVSKMMQGVAAAKEPNGKKRAIELLRAAVKDDPKLWEARFDLGVLLAETGSLAQAEKQLAEAAKLAPNAEDIAVALGEVRRRRGDPESAAEGLEKFVKDHPKALTARTGLVSALREAGQVERAIEHAREVLVRRSNDPNALAELALSHLALGEMDTAELLSAESLKAGNSAVAERTAGLVALRRGDDAVAFQHFAKASELDPTDTTARLNMGTVLLQAGVYERAVVEFRGVLAVKPEDVDAKIGLAAALRGMGARDKPGSWSEAERVLKEVLDRYPDNLAANLNLGLLYADFMQKPGLAKPLLKKFLDDAPDAHPARGIVSKKIAAMK